MFSIEPIKRYVTICGGIRLCISVCACGYLSTDYNEEKCKVIRIGKRVQPATSKARQQVNIDRPTYTKTDKQCHTRTTITAWLPDDQVPPLR